MLCWATKTASQRKRRIMHTSTMLTATAWLCVEMLNLLCHVENPLHVAWSMLLFLKQAEKTFAMAWHASLDTNTADELLSFKQATCSQVCSALHSLILDLVVGSSRLSILPCCPSGPSPLYTSQHLTSSSYVKAPGKSVPCSWSFALSYNIACKRSAAQARKHSVARWKYAAH